MKFNIKEIKEGFIANGYKFLYKQFTRDFYRRQCCNNTPEPEPEPIFNFDVTGNWGLGGVTDSASFQVFLETLGFTNVTVSDYSLVNSRLIAVVSITGAGGKSGFDLSRLEITEVNILPQGDYSILYLTNNQIVDFNPTIPLPTGLQDLNLSGNQLTSFNPTIALPTGLQYLNLSNNQIVDFNPTIPLPTGLQILSLNNNQLVDFNPTILLPTGLQHLYLNNNQIVDFNPTVALPTGLQRLVLSSNQLTTFNPTVPLPTGLQDLFLETNQIVDWSLSESWANLQPNGTALILTAINPTSSNGTTFKSILTGKGYTVNS